MDLKRNEMYMGILIGLMMQKLRPTPLMQSTIARICALYSSGTLCDPWTGEMHQAVRMANLLERLKEAARNKAQFALPPPPADSSNA